MDRLKLREDDVVWREVEGEIVAFDMRTSTYLAVNPTGTVLWPHLLKGATRDDLVQRLIEAFDVDVQIAGRDVDAFIDNLESNELLEPR